MKKLALLVSIVAPVALLAALQGSREIVWKPETGATTKVRLTMTAKTDGSAGFSDMNAKFIVTSAIKSVNAEKVVQEEGQTAESILIDGMDMTDMLGDMVNSTSTSEYKRNGALISTINEQLGDFDSSVPYAMAFVYPGSSIKIGGSWQVEGAAVDGRPEFKKSYTLKSVGKEGDTETLVIEVLYEEEGDDQPMSYKGTVHIAADGSGIVKALYEIKNLELGPGLVASEVTIEEVRI